ncbi:MAG TPA: glutamyl-tRNA reductase [Candidatus Udaeobacter sp.]|nr:glutamyl-tRNA reductase [Candidatus Udaeobacter sp.]
MSVRALDPLRVLSINFRTAPLDQLERVALAPARRDELMSGLADAGIAASALLTCHRTELYWISRGAHDDAEVERALTAASGEPLPPAQRARGREVARHLFRVASGIESLALGESEVLGQVRQMQARSSQPMLTVMIAAALRCGRRARARTSIAAGAVSIASLAAQSLLERLEQPESRSIIVLGAGATGVAAARHLRAEGASRLTVVNRSAGPARALATELGCASAPIEKLNDLLGEADAVVVSIAAPHPILTPERMAEAGRAPGRPLVIVDLSLPRAADPALAIDPGITLRDLSSLEEAAEANHARRALELPRAEAVIERELAAFYRRAEREPRPPAVLPLPGVAAMRIDLAREEQA